MAAIFWAQGLRFECQGTGRCCVSRGSYGYVYLTLDDRRALAAHLGLRTSTFTRRYCLRKGDHFHLKDTRGPCQFLEGTGKLHSPDEIREMLKQDPLANVK